MISTSKIDISIVVFLDSDSGFVPVTCGHGLLQNCTRWNTKGVIIITLYPILNIIFTTVTFLFIYFFLFPRLIFLNFSELYSGLICMFLNQ